MAEGKWIGGLTPEMLPEDAARHVLDVRFAVVKNCLPRAALEAEQDTEHVHQLRVGSRRAGAALRIFAGCLPRKVYRSARGRLRSIRRAAAAARDWDVFLLDLRGRVPQQARAERPGYDFLIGYAQGQRAVAQEQLGKVFDAEWPGFEAFVAALIDSVRPPQDADAGVTLASLGRELLADRLKKLECAAGKDLSDYPNLHQVRIGGKRLRYAMEVFADCFPGDFRDLLYPQVEAMQETLGTVNDSHVAAGRLAALRDRMKRVCRAEWQRLQPGVNALLQYHRRRLPQGRRHFLKLWRQWLRPETVSLWEALLAGEPEAVASARP
jgi:CHAD domain-containing protein